MSETISEEVVLLVDPTDPRAWERLAAVLSRLAGRRVRVRIGAGEEVREFEGRVARPSEWPAADDPFLLLRPGATDRTHVLAYMALHFRFREGHVLLARRRHYEKEPLDFQRLPAGAVELRLVVLPDR